MHSEEEILLLLCRQNLSDEQQLQVKDLASKVNWAFVCKLASVHKIENYIYNNLRNNGLLSILPNNIEKRLKSVYYQVSIRNTQFKSLIENISNLCYSTKIILVKGSSLIYDFYQDLGARHLADIDILVQKQDRDTVWNALTSSNWHSDNWPGLKSKAHNIINDECYKTMHYLYYGEAENSQFVDIHWKFYVGEGADNVASYAFETAKKIQNNLYVHTNEMQVIHLCTNNYLDYKQGGVMYLRNLSDINEFILSRKINWNRIEQICKFGGSDSIMREAVVYSLNVIESLFETAIPVQFKQQIFEGIDITPTSLLQLPVTILKKSALQSIKEKANVLGKPSLILLFLLKEVIPDHKWLKGMYHDSHAPLLSYWSYMVRRHLLHKNIRYNG
ncbi:MAG: nucleotidyltransferase family protein [Paludibacteraceae bacterium]|nr:nucleotidyltransferase family protein [Paludibacteraceae bacterium]